VTDLRALEEWAGALLVRLEPAERRRLNRDIARDLRRSQQQRIAAQRAPDGTPYEPRKRNLRGKKGRVRRTMFAKLRTAKHLKLQGDANSIAIGFFGRTARIARVHQRGFRDRPARGMPDVQYPQRELLGFTEGNLEMIRQKLLDHLVT
jgi:phage virion morphogenesis protein